MTPPERDHIMKRNQTTHLRMRDLQPLGVQDIKDQAQRLRKALRGSVELKHTQSLEMAAKMHGFESWGQAKAHLDLMARSGGKSPKGGRALPWRSPNVSSFAEDFLACRPTVTFIPNDEDRFCRVAAMEYARLEAGFQRACSIMIDRPYSISSMRSLYPWDLRTLEAHLGRPIKEKHSSTYELVMEEFQADAPSRNVSAPSIMLLPWVRGDGRLSSALQSLRAHGICTIIYARKLDVDRASDEELEALLDACDLWGLSPGMSLPRVMSHHGDLLHNDGKDDMIFRASDVRDISQSPDYGHLATEPSDQIDGDLSLDIVLRYLGEVPDQGSGLTDVQG
jgi:hypothetical protein